MDAIELTSAADRNRTEIHALEKKSGVELSDCYQCGKCSAGCPVAFAMDKTPRQVIRLLQLGLLEEALESRTIWLCATCQTCVTRCPKEVDLPSLMEAIRQAAKKKGIVSEKNINMFSDIFLQNVKAFGRSQEVYLSVLYNLRSGHFLQDALSSPHLFLTGKASVFPEKVKNIDAIKKIFAKCVEGGEHS